MPYMIIDPTDTLTFSVSILRRKVYVHCMHSLVFTMYSKAGKNEGLNISGFCMDSSRGLFRALLHNPLSPCWGAFNYRGPLKHPASPQILCSWWPRYIGQLFFFRVAKNVAFSAMTLNTIMVCSVISNISRRL